MILPNASRRTRRDPLAGYCSKKALDRIWRKKVLKLLQDCNVEFSGARTSGTVAQLLTRSLQPMADKRRCIPPTTRPAAWLLAARAQQGAMPDHPRTSGVVTDCGIERDIRLTKPHEGIRLNDES